jgi:Zn-dependent protease with chaperone function
MTTQKTNKSNVEKIFEELKEKGLINKKRKLKESKKLNNFRSGHNKIIFNSAFKNLDKNYLRLILLHEEAHITKKQRSKLLLILSLFLSFFVYCILSKIKISTLFLTLISLFIFFLVFRAFINYVKEDEYDSDLMACIQLKKYYKIKNIPKLLENSLKSMKFERNKSFFFNFFFFIYSLIRYHPPLKERVNKIKTLLDD